MGVLKLVSELNSIHIFHFIWWGCWGDQSGDEKDGMVMAMLVIFQLEGKERKAKEGCCWDWKENFSQLDWAVMLRSQRRQDLINEQQ